MMPRHKRRNGRRRYRLNPKLLPTAGLTLLAVGMVVVVFMMLMPGGSISVFNQPTPTPTAQPTAEPTEVPTQAPTPTPQIYNEVRVRAAGDIMVHDDELLSAKQDDGSYDFTSFFGEIADSLGDADYTMANLETTVGEAGSKGYTGYPNFHTPTSLLTALKGTGIDMLTTSNNHCLDRYFDGLVETLDSLDAAGFDHTGTFRNKQEYQTAYVKEVNGIKIGVVAYTYGTNGMEEDSDPDGVEWGIMYLSNANFEKSAQRLREAGAEVLGVASIFTYGMKKGLDRMKEANVVNYSLSNLDALVEVAAEEGYIKPEDKARLLKFRDNPSDESWMEK